MKWIIKDKELIIKTKFAILPKRIGDYRIWLEKYYETYDYVHAGVFSCYVPYWFIHKEEAELYVKGKTDPDSQY